MKRSAIKAMFANKNTLKDNITDLKLRVNDYNSKNNTNFRAGIYGSNGYSFFNMKGQIIHARTKDKLISKMSELDKFKK